MYQNSGVHAQLSCFAPLACCCFLHLYGLAVVAAAGRSSSVNVTESCQRLPSEKRTTLIVAWWGPGIRAEPGAPGQGPCRLAPCPGAEPGGSGEGPSQTASCFKSKPGSLTVTKTAHSPVAGGLQAGRKLSPEPGDMHSHTPRPHAYEQGSGSSLESAASSDSDSDLVPQLEPATSALSNCEPDLQIQCCMSASPESTASLSRLLWLQQCQLTPQQQTSLCAHQQPQTAPASSTDDIAANVSSSQGTNVGSAVSDRKANSTAGALWSCHRPQAARGYNPSTISPVWMHIGAHLKEEEQCHQADTQQIDRRSDQQDDWQNEWQGDPRVDQRDNQRDEQQDDQQHKRRDDRQDERRDDQQDDQQDGQQDDQQSTAGQDRQQLGWHDSQQDGGQNIGELQEGTQPAAKRQRQANWGDSTGAVTPQHQLLVPLPPLRFFLRSVDEITSVYQPSRPSIPPSEP